MSQIHLPKPPRYVRWTPHPAIVTRMDKRDYIRVLLYSYYTTITGWGVLLKICNIIAFWAFLGVSGP